MLPLIVALGGSIISRRMAEGEVFTSGFKDLWNAWELRGMVFLSLSIQVLLIYLGNRRKHSPGAFSTFITWIAYMTADPVAIYALGIITNKLTRSSDPKSDLAIQLRAFWAPFLLLHLGGPDTITAYALEDNELWLRHMLSLFTQTAVTFYIFLMAWNSSNLSILTIGMIFAGLSKYGERVWVLWAASTEQFRDSIPEHPLNFSKVVEEHKLMEAEGFYVVPHEVLEVQEAVLGNSLENTDFSSDEKELTDKEIIYKRSRGELLMAGELFNIFQRLFADLLLSFQDRDISLAILEGKHYQVAFKIIEIELGLMYDILYTKAMVIDKRWGAARRVVVMLFSVVVLVIFSLAKVHKSYSRVDLGMTFLLLGVAIFLEVYALMFLAFSDKVACWLIKKRKFKVLRFIDRFQPLSARKRWSGTAAQFSLLSFSLKENHLFCDRLLKLLKFDEKIEKHMYKSHERVTNELKERIMQRFKVWKSTGKAGGSHVLEKFNEKDRLRWSIELEFDQGIAVWYIATELCLNPRDPNSLTHQEPHHQEYIRLSCRISKVISRYFMYLLVFHPYMLPTELGRLKFADTYLEAMKFFDEQKSVMKEKRKTGKSKVSEACEQLRHHVKTKLNLTIVKEDKSKFVLFHGCLLASQLEEVKDNQERLEIISEMWIEILALAASKCKASYHCQQLRRGGELLTHVWLLMAHLGLTDHFRIPHAPSITEFIVR